MLDRRPLLKSDESLGGSLLKKHGDNVRTRRSGKRVGRMELL